ncbi:uncharacterized protein LAESUDRAFT_486351 [Laetiporus sulphureus 93-53]|uniref:F-box domain-containing protein n=1 Tax=Laetiporus sulphureus 93-53 TaxID=1314785 RepID=A0A165BN66_9APHY|nr:uncharacterized protein LAESUDRAFT_486351 [Laetiporus sulphureus 93-53]KZT01346.1 hypothetical protein LAESUDRAFT_486351 [Laetiporus sulphureus 93-53]
MCLTFVPVELLLDILSLALQGHPRPTDVLCVDKSFAELGQRILHSDLRFRTVRQLIRFSEERAVLACPPKTLTISLSGGAASFDVFLHLAVALRRCRMTLTMLEQQEGPHDQTAQQQTQVPLDLLSLCLHSHTRNPSLEHIYEALSMANPKTFVWTGPDPAHHFSTAIVPAATFYLFRAIRTWSDITHITLTNLAFPSDDLGLHAPLARNVPLLPVIPSLRTLSIGQATLLPPSSIAAMICLPGQDHLENIRLVDAYSESIWGPRIRRRDVERAAVALKKAASEEVIAKVRRLVRCEAKTERIMGGDRVEGTLVLD